jgi:hypothetical protein
MTDFKFEDLLLIPCITWSCYIHIYHNQLNETAFNIFNMCLYCEYSQT